MKPSIAFSIILLITSLKVYSSPQLGLINDPDGYTNIRKSNTQNSEIVFKITDGEYFYYEPDETQIWLAVTNMECKTGFIHKSRIKTVNEITIDQKKYKSKDIKLKIQTRKVGNTSIKITQIKNLRSFDDKTFYHYYCHAYVDITQTNGKYKQYKYEDIQPLGGDAGVEFLASTIPGHILVVKHGDYDGRTILVSSKGNITEIPRGSVSNLIDNKYLINFHECDIGTCGFTVYSIFSEQVEMVYDTEFEEYQLGNKLILDLKFEEGFDLYEIDFTHKKIIKSSIKDNKTIKYFDNYIKDDLIDDCFSDK